MTSRPYTTDEAACELGAVLDHAPPGAVTGRWRATTVQAGHAEQTGGYADAEGRPVEGSSDRLSDPVFDAVRDVVDRLDAAGAARFNTVVIRWTRARPPWHRGRVTVETSFDAANVPRGPDDPSYAAAAAARCRFWQAQGELSPGYAAERGTPNGFGQTRWYGPHVG